MSEHTNIEFRIDHSSRVPLYVQVEQLLRELIALPEYQEGALLPNEVDLSQRLSVSRSTMRQALSNLVNEGLLERKKGVGTRVTRKSTISRLDNWLSFTREMNAKGLEVINYELMAGVEPAGPEVASALGIEEGRQVVRLYRLRGTTKFPAVVTTSWLHPRIGITSDEDFSLPLYEILDSKYHIVVHFSKEEIKAEKAGEYLSGKLKVSPSDPVLCRYRVVSDIGRRPVEFNKTYYRADSFSYFIELHRS